MTDPQIFLANALARTFDCECGDDDVICSGHLVERLATAVQGALDLTAMALHPGVPMAPWHFVDEVRRVITAALEGAE